LTVTERHAPAALSIAANCVFFDIYKFVHCNRSCITMLKGKHNLHQEEHLCSSDEWLVVAIASLQPAQALVEVT